SGTPGEASPTKLFSLVGAGVDAEGNLFVCMGRNETIIRQFDPDRKQVWEVQSHPFVECFDFDPTADGERIYGIEQIIEMDYTRPPGQQWRLKSMTRNLVRFPDDQRAKDASGWSTYLRWIDGKRVMFGIGQMAGGLHVMVFDDPPSDIARYCGFIDAHGGGWAWEVDERGNIWQGESAGKSIRRYPFGGFDEKGNPIYDPSKAERFDWPAPFERVQRVKYIATTDTMYIAGYVPGKGERSWGLVGAVLCRYDNWMKGNRTAAYTVDLPVDGEKLHPKSMDVAGDYVFFAMVKPTNNRPAMVHVLDNRTGGYVGAMWPGETVGGNSGWIDTVTGMRAFRRKNGEYLVLIEEGWRAKNILYRWTPTTSD
ncbi:MAG TPA: hypothetical protein PKB10_09360, partial [Tepidisphaeraceae bacterium]|nr:hypothetical protein [Tepidisphaeraceae bacterium]